MGYGKPELDAKTATPQNDMNMSAGNTPAMDIPPVKMLVVTELDSRNIREGELLAIRRNPFRRLPPQWEALALTPSHSLNSQMFNINL
jgi:hypothetical protein